MNTILCIDKNSALSERLSIYLTQNNIATDFHNAIEDCMSCIIRGSYNLVLINMDYYAEWISIVATIRRKSTIPIVLTEKKHNIANAVTAFRIGADDYIVESTDILEIALRLESLVRRYTEYARENDSISECTMVFKNLRIDKLNHTVWKNDRELELTKTEFELLYFFVRHKGQVISREQLCESIWRDEYVADDKSIISHIHRLRMKIEDKPSEPQYILTVRGIGYKFNAELLK